MLGLLQHAKAYERLAVRGGGPRRPRAAFEALLANPLVRDAETARLLLGAILEAGGGHLPRFSR